ncbi:MAG: hypothetical protein Q8K71_17430 [Polaromonas sp.]|nr:hypothetical protein [Polaromonas sp.]MDP3752120.1 hypothetical protein [Polaromonas sp.]
MKFDALGNQVEISDDGSLTVTTKGGAVYKIDKDGKPTIDLKTLKGISIGNLIDVVDYQITRVAGIISHFVRFVDNGVLEFAYNTNGKLVSMSMERLEIAISVDNYVTVSKHKHPDT